MPAVGSCTIALSMALALPLAAQSPAEPVRTFLVAVAPTESLRVTVAGRGTTVVLIPGLFGSAFGFRHLLAALPRLGYRAVVIEPLGIGGSPRPRTARYTLTSQADRLAAAIARLTSEPVVLVAHSVGVSMALRLGYRHPDRVRSIIAIDGGPAEEAATPGLRRAMRYAPWIKWLGGVRRIRPKIRHELVAASGDPRWVTDAVVEQYTAGAAADLDGTLLAFLAMAESSEPERIGPRLARLRIPVRLLVGGAPHRGGVSPGHVRLMTERIARFSVDTVPGAGQYLFEERPAAVVAAIVRASRDLHAAR